MKKHFTLFTALLIILFSVSGCGTNKLPEEAVTEAVEEPKGNEISTYLLAAGTEMENEVYVIKAQEEGPVFYIVAGIHGDEPAGWTAGNQLKEDLKDKIKRGTLYILSPANKTGAEDKTRFVRNSGDLNRAFPGDITSDELSERIAAVMFEEMEAKNPDFILDLHEARWELGGHSTGGGLGNTLIYTKEELVDDYLFDFLIENEEGNLFHHEVALTTPGVADSFNRVISEQLDIPVVTVETLQTNDLEERITDQKDTVCFFLKKIGMMEEDNTK